MSNEVKATVASDAKPFLTAGREDAVKLRLLGAAKLLEAHKPENVVIEVEITDNTPVLANGHRLVRVDKIFSSGTAYQE